MSKKKKNKKSCDNCKYCPQRLTDFLNACCHCKRTYPDMWKKKEKDDGKLHDN